MISIRAYKIGDERYLREIFFNTIRQININDYTQKQVIAWAPESYDEAQWQSRIQVTSPFIALIDDKIVGYSDVQNDGYIDHFFCHSDYQGKGIGKTLMQTLLDAANKKRLERLYSHVSITAKPFFEHFGFKVVNPQQVEIRGEILTNYVMEKIISNT
ncbi:GNAT family N-acetyltransferase [Pseudoalteromonas sp. C2R02]|uniref:GNAT family N-acetyltransferase n=1 Tax=Pseudoalteromonas sp. C2R02 TaxID=2841565 RepID=UPI001C085C64|nr:GNAT family N-acetyltransferase [Pseudoalteromonas sp. C2R02]